MLDRAGASLTRDRGWIVPLLLACSLAVGARPAGGDPPPPLNFVVIVTDDQRWDTVWAMPSLQEIAESSVRFTNAYVTTPLCSPARASFLSGGYLAQNTGVRDNAGAQVFFDADTLATRMQDAGYATGLVGKYINPYEDVAPYVPPGWTRFVVNNDDGHEPDWFSYHVTTGSTTTSPATGSVVGPITQYLTDFQRDEALSFIDDHASEPFLLWLALHAPHAPSTPAPGDEGLFPGYVYQHRAWGEADLSDKPAAVRSRAVGWNPLQNLGPLHLRPLAAVDRAVAAIRARLEALGLLDRTVLIFTSDNGFLWGEHRLTAKAWPYEEAIRVPLIVAAPGVAAQVDEHLVATNLDVGATVLELAGLAPVGDGASLAPLLAGEAPPWRGEVLIESFSDQRVWSGLRTRDALGEWKYVEWSNGDRELYDLLNDPYEEQSLHADPARTALREALAARLAARRATTIVADGPGFALRSNGAIELPPGVVGKPYDVQVPRWAGEPPLRWERIFDLPLPSGLALDGATGRLSGIPDASAQSFFWLGLSDGATTTQYGGPQSHAAALVYTMRQPACSDGIDNDADGLTDFPEDVGCLAAVDDLESPRCQDGLDNEAIPDGRIDFDGGQSIHGACSGGACPAGVSDPDGDGVADPDPECASPWVDREAAGKACGLGFEGAPVLLAALAWRRRHRA